jgi:DNA-binding LacI/PurR family transcriptional regulator
VPFFSAYSQEHQPGVSRYLRDGHVDGAVLVSMHGKGPLDLHSPGVPVVLAGRPFGSDDDLPYVDAGNVAARAWPCSIAQARPGRGGHGAGPPDMSPGVDRLRGYRTAMAEAGLSDSGLVVFGDVSRVSAEHAV